MIAAIQRLLRRGALSAGPARVAKAAAEIRVPMPAAGRGVPLSGGAVSSGLSRGRGAEDQRERSQRDCEARAEDHSADHRRRFERSATGAKTRPVITTLPDIVER